MNSSTCFFKNVDFSRNRSSPPEAIFAYLKDVKRRQRTSIWSNLVFALLDIFAAVVLFGKRVNSRLLRLEIRLRKATVLSRLN